MNPRIHNFIWSGRCVGLALLAAVTAQGATRGTLNANLPLSFEANLGQSEGAEQFIARGANYYFSVAPTETRVSLRKLTSPVGVANDSAAINRPSVAASSVSYRTVRMELVAANPEAVVTGEAELPGRVNYFLGNDPGKWRAGVPTFGRVRVTGIYPGINVVHYGNQHSFEHDFEVAAGADPAAIAIRYTGADHVQVDPHGDLVLTVGAEEIRQPKPLIYQEVNGARTMIEGGYRIVADTVTFWLGKYDPSRSLVIDPVLSYSTFYGGTSSDNIWALALDGNGNIYLAGETMSAQLQTTGAFQTNLAGVTSFNGDVLLTKVDNFGSTKLFSTYLGGSRADSGLGLALDAAGNAYLTGFTDSPDFPTKRALQTNIAGAIIPGYGGYALDAFVTEVDATGSNLVFSTYYGGSGNGVAQQGSDVGFGIALDANTNILVAGYTYSTNFPCLNTTRTNIANVAGFADAFVLKLGAAGSNVIYAMYLGGTNEDFATGVAADAAGSAYVFGRTLSANFPLTNAVQTLFNDTTNASLAYDGFVSKIAPDAGALVYSTYLGGTNNDFVVNGALAASGEVFVTGATASGDFPRTSTNFSSFVASNVTTIPDVFVAKLGAAGTNLDYSVVFGGSALDQGWSVAVDSAGIAYVAGATSSPDFPTHGVSGYLRGTLTGGADAFIASVNSNGTALSYSAYLGGSADDLAHAIMLDLGGNLYVAGETSSSDFPAFYPGLDDKYRGNRDAFLAKLVSPPVLSITRSDTNVVIAWPGFGPEYNLQGRGALTTNASWTSVVSTPAATNGQHTVTLSATNTAQFFRLFLQGL